MIRKARTEQDYLALIASMGDWFWEMDSDFVYTYSGQQIETILGYSPEEIIGRTPFSLAHQDEAERVRQRFSEMRDQNEPFRFLIKFNRLESRRILIYFVVVVIVI